MTDDTETTANVDVTDLDLSDAELLTVLQNHGIDRRSVTKLIGVGAGVAALGGPAAASRGGGGSDAPGARADRIDEVYGAAYAAGIDTVPSGIVDHEVGLHIHEGDGVHEGFPRGDDTVDADPATPGFQADPNDQDDVPEFFFDPVGLHVTPGDVVAFSTHGPGLHTVTSFDPKFNEPPFLTFPDRVPTDHGFTSPPVATGDTWLYRFTEKGVYDLLCLPHVFVGMVMRIVVFDDEEDDITDPTFDEPAPDPQAPLLPLAAAVLNDDALDPADVVREGSVAWADLSLP